jgi:hypothetical protein
MGPKVASLPSRENSGLGLGHVPRKQGSRRGKWHHHAATVEIY